MELLSRDYPEMRLDIYGKELPMPRPAKAPSIMSEAYRAALGSMSESDLSHESALAKDAKDVEAMSVIVDEYALRLAAKVGGATASK